MSELLPEEIPEDAFEDLDVADPPEHAPGDPEAQAVARASGDPETDVPERSDHLVPVWLAALVLMLLLAVMAVGGYALRGVFENNTPSAGRDLEIEKWESEVKLTPNDPEARLNLAFAYQQAARFDDALEQYDLVLADSPRETAALYNKGVVFRELDRIQDAEAVWWDVLEIEPEHVLAAKALGELYAEQREYRSLIEAVRPVVEVNESSADLQYLMGLAYENLGRRDWAIARYELALKYYPDMKEAREGLDRLGTSQ